MTAEQVSDLFLQLERLHPSDEKQTYHDPDFDREMAEAQEAEKGVIWPDTVVVPFGAPPPPEAAVPAEWRELSDYDLDKLE